MKFPVLPLALVLSSMIFTSCEDSNESGIVHLEGTVNLDDIAFVQKMYADSTVVIDTLDLAGNKFSADLPAITDDEVYTVVFPGNYSVRFVGTAGESISMEVNIRNDFPYYSVQGNASSVKMATQHDIMGETMRVLDSLDAVNLLYADSANIDEIRHGLQNVFQSTLIKHRDALYSMIVEDTTDISNMFAFYHTVGNTRILTPQADMDLFLSVGNGVHSRYPNNSLVQGFYKSIEELKANIERSKQVESSRLQIQKGNLAPSITMNDPFGNERSLKDLRGNIVLIDFWASWCGPCRRNNPHLVEMYQKYKDSGFEIFSVSIDGGQGRSLPMEEWRNAIQADRLTWPNHVSDLKGWESPVVADYGINGIPYTVLIDRDGFILGTNLRGQALEEQLKIYLGH